MNRIIFLGIPLWISSFLNLFGVHHSGSVLVEKKKAFVVMGYNNTRINDVAKIRSIAKEEFQASTVLCKLNPTQDDFRAVDYVIDTSLMATREIASEIVRQLEQLQIMPVAILPFSDQGVPLGALLAQQLNLPGANPLYTRAGLDKSFFREAESKALSYPEKYNPIFSKRISSEQEMIEALKNHPKGLFVKPCQEGNNRGCIAVHSEAECKEAWALVSPYQQGGIIAEELVKNAQEYSCDCSGATYWVTEKEISLGISGKYRVEIQCIVPAPLNNEKQKICSDAGKFMAELSGVTIGAYHNEIFVTDDDRIMAVEPNLRPAGPRIWDCAKLAFYDFDPWKEWLEVMIGNKTVQQSKKLERKFFVGERFICAAKDGILASLPTIELPHQVIEIVWTKKIGDHVIADQKNNADYIGYIMVKG